MENDLPLLLLLSKKTELRNSIVLSTGQLATELKVSQQTVSRKLIELETKGLIRRQPTIHGISIQISEKGRKVLDETYTILKQMFENSKLKSPVLKGKVCSGLGEGKFYVQQQGYIKQFKEKIGFVPYGGTLNIQVSCTEVNNFLSFKKNITVEGFSTNERTFGGIDCYPVLFNHKVKSALIIPERTHHPENVSELIAPIYLRGHFKLHDGEEVLVE